MGPYLKHLCQNLKTQWSSCQYCYSIVTSATSTTLLETLMEETRNTFFFPSGSHRYSKKYNTVDLQDSCVASNIQSVLPRKCHRSSTFKEWFNNFSNKEWIFNDILPFLWQWLFMVIYFNYALYMLEDHSQIHEDKTHLYN